MSMNSDIGCYQPGVHQCTLDMINDVDMETV